MTFIEGALFGVTIALAAQNAFMFAKMKWLERRIQKLERQFPQSHITRATPPMRGRYGTHNVIDME